jgi:hypothetical protein
MILKFIKKHTKSIPRKILILALALFFLNLFDAGATTYLVLTGNGTEMNPIMIWALDQGLAVFWTIKVLLAAAVSWFFAKVHEFKLARFGLWLVVISYGLLALYYVVGFVYLAFF